MSKRAKAILLALASLTIIGTFVLNIVYDSVVVTPETEQIIDVNGNRKDYTVMKYSPEYKYPKALGEFFYTLGIAVLIYLLIEHTLSNYENNRREKELEEKRDKINKDIFEGVFKKIIPEALFEIVTNDILYKEFIRKNVKWEYEISEDPNNRGYNLEQMIIYELCNITSSKTVFPLTISIQHTEENNAFFEAIEVQTMDGKKVPVSPVDRGGERKLNLDFEPGQTLKIIHHLKIEYSGYHVIDCHFTNYSIVGLEIRVRKPADCTFRPVPTFSCAMQVLKEDHNTIIYKPVKGLLKGQALVYLLDKQHIEQPSKSDLKVEVSGEILEDVHSKEN
jgi:hypothetical protein